VIHIPEDMLTPITKVLLKENDNLALIFPKDISKDPKFELYFFRVMRRYPLHRTYDSELPELPPGATVDFTYLGTKGLGSGDDTLTIWEERPFRILHFAFGLKPSNIWLYKAIPADVAQTAFAYKEPTKVGFKYDYIPGSLSPYENPTVSTETVLYHKLSIRIGLKNNHPFTVRPAIRILGAGYDCIPIADREFINKMLAGIIPVRYITVGGLSYFTYTVPEVWKGYAVVVDRRVIEEIMTRRW